MLFGRSLPYGEGVTYWPLAEMVKASAGISDDDPVDEAQAKLREYCEDEEVADLLGLAVGVLAAVEGERAQREIAWAARAWAAQLAQAQPLILVFEDTHWGEEPLLELIEHLAAWVKDAPLLIICLARAELLDVRPTWGGGRVRATTIQLEPLREDESAELVAALTADLDMPLDLRTVLAKTEGNPLFVEETVRMLAERPRDGFERIPDTLQALIAARIDRLPTSARSALQRAAVMGRIFMGGALEALSPELAEVDDALDQLLLRDLVVLEPRASISGEQAYKFKHVLIREVAYAGLSKGSRADLHYAFAQWLGERAGDELLEIRAFHLDQAARLLTELDGTAPADLREEAAVMLTKAGHRALSREAFRSARKLLLRAVELAPTLERRYLAGRAAWRLADFPAVMVEMNEVAEQAEKAGETVVQGRALTALAEAVLQHKADAADAGLLAARALEVLENEAPGVRFEPLWILVAGGRLAERHGRVRALCEGGTRGGARGRAQGPRGARHPESRVLVSLPAGDRRGGSAHRPRVRARQCEWEHHRPCVRARGARLVQPRHGAARGGRGRLRDARELFAEIGNTRREAIMLMLIGRAAFAQGHDERAEAILRDAVRTLKGLGDRGSLCEAQRALAMVLAEEGKLDEAERHALEARETVGPEDRVSVGTTLLALGVVRSKQHRDEEAEQLIRESIDVFNLYGLRALEHWGLRVLVEFLRERGRDDEAVRLRRTPRGARPDEHRPNRLSRLLVGRLADHRRGTVEAIERIA